MCENIHVRNFDICPKLLAHEFAMLRLSKTIESDATMDKIYGEYIKEFKDADTTIQDKIRYIHPSPEARQPEQLKCDERQCKPYCERIADNWRPK